MIDHIRQILLLSLIVTILSVRDVTSDEHQQRNYRLVQRRSAEHDNEYVWFTRNVPENLDENIMPINPVQQRKPMDWIIRHRQHPWKQSGKNN